MNKTSFLVLTVLLTASGCAGGDPVEVVNQSTQTEQIDLMPFSQETPAGGRFGYRDSTGVVIEPRFLVAQNFSESGLAAVVDETGWAYINVHGQIVIRPFVFDNGPDYFSEGLARFEEDGRFGFFDEVGRVVIEPRFDFARPFSEGLAAVCSGCRRVTEGEHWYVQGGKWGYIDQSGKVAIPLRYDRASSFEGGHARVVQAGEPITIARDSSRLDRPR